MFHFKPQLFSICLAAASLFSFTDQVAGQDRFHQPYATNSYNIPCNDCFSDASALAAPQASTWAEQPFAEQPTAQPVGESYFIEDQIADNPWFVRFGVGVLLFGESATLRANDVVVPGAGLDISNATTFAFDIGYQLSPVWTATFSVGVPPKLDLDGTGTFAGVQYGTTRFAPVALTLQRHFFVTQRTSIYVGGGINYNAQYETKDGFIQNFNIKNDAAVILQLGLERRINDRISLFADAKKSFYRTQAYGNIGPVQTRTDATVNPTALVFGLKYDF